MAARFGSLTRSAVFAPFGDVGRASAVEKRLAEAIRTGILDDGERLPHESDLAEMLGVAPITAREALVALRSQGLVTTVSGRGGGSFVLRPRVDDDTHLRRWLATMTRVDLADRGVHYSTILAGCAELAAERARPEDLADLRGIVPAAIEGFLVESRYVDTELHLALAALSQSARLSREVIRLEADFGALLRLPFADPDHRTMIRGHQLAVIGAIEAHDPAAARTRMRARVRAALGDLVELQDVVR